MSWKSRTIVIFIIVILESIIVYFEKPALVGSTITFFVVLLLGKRGPEGAVFPSILKLENRKIVDGED